MSTSHSADPSGKDGIVPESIVERSPLGGVEAIASAVCRDLSAGDLSAGDLSAENLNPGPLALDGHDPDALPRVTALERALDQALGEIHELRQQLRDQQLLESQLAATEEYSQIQQRVIVDLRVQLQTQAATPEREAAQHQSKLVAAQGVLTEAEGYAEAQKQQLGRLRLQLRQDRAEAQMQQLQLERQLEELRETLNQQQHQIEELESQGLAARSQSINLDVQRQEAQQQVEQLQETLQNRRAAFARLQDQLEESREALQSQQELGVAQTRTIAKLTQDLATARRKTEELEVHLDRQNRIAAHLQQTYQEMGQERDQSQERITGLERQITEMQEQILQQVQQGREYETAVQHWRTRYLTLQAQMERLATWLRERMSTPASSTPASSTPASSTPAPNALTSNPAMVLGEDWVVLQGLLEVEGGLTELNGESWADIRGESRGEPSSVGEPLGRLLPQSQDELESEGEAAHLNDPKVQLPKFLAKKQVYEPS